MIYTGIDGRKVVSVSYSKIKKEWEFSKKWGKKIYVIPSHLSFVKIEKTDITNRYALKKYMSLEIEEKFGNVKWDVNVDENLLYLVVFKGYEEPEDYFALDSEIFSLARVLRANGKSDGIVLDIGENKTTYVSVKDGKIDSYRVVLKGGKYIDKKVSEAYGIDLEESEGLKRREGLGDKKVREAFEEIISSIGHEFSSSEVLLSGGLSKLRRIEDFFGKVIFNKHCEPHLNSAFGASLKYIYKDKSPDFRSDTIEPSDIRRFAVIGGLSAVFLLASLVALNFGGGYVIKELKNKQKEEFKEAFPNLPAVSVYDQVKGLISSGDKYILTRKWEKFLDKMTRNVIIYKIEYNGDAIIVKGETSDEGLVNLLEPKAIKKTPKGSIEFELEIK